MIAFFAGTPEDALAIARAFTSGTPEVDGPFHLHRGNWLGQPAAVYLVTEGADMAYAGARLAARRGAKAMVSVARAASASAEEAPLGSLVPAGAIWNLEGLLPMQRLLPDSAAELPLELDPLLPPRAVWTGREDMPGLGSALLAVRAPLLLTELQSRRGIALVDGWTSGLAEAAAEEEIPLRPHAFVDAAVVEGELVEAGELLLARHRDAQFAELMAVNTSPPRGTPLPSP